MTHIKRMVMHGFKSFARRTEINFDQGISIVLGPNGSGKCVDGATLVSLGDGSFKRIDELVNARLDSAAKTEDGYISAEDGTEVMCLDMTSLKTEKKRIKAFVKRSAPDSMLTIRTRSGRTIKSTPYHPFFILKEGNVVPAKAEELSIGARIAIPRKIPFSPKSRVFTELLDKIKPEDSIYIPYQEELIALFRAFKDEKNVTWKEASSLLNLPYMTLKSYLDHQSINAAYLIRGLLSAGCSDLEIISRIKTITSNGKITRFPFENSPEFARFLGYLLAEGRLADSSQIWFTNGDSEIVADYVSLVHSLFGENPLIREYKKGCWDVIIFSEPLRKLLAKLGMAKQTEHKYISNAFFSHSGEKEIAELLNGLYCGDGYVSKNTIEITTKSEKLARGIEQCLLRLGMVPRTRKVFKGIKKLNFIGEYFSVALNGVDNFKSFKENICLVHNAKRSRIESNSLKKSNSNVDLVEANALVKKAVKELSISVKPTHSVFPRLDSYCYSDTLPSREGLSLLLQKVLKGTSNSCEQLAKLASADIFWDELVSIEKTDGKGWVYDLCVDEHHNFIANGIFAHNSNVADGLCFVLGRLSIKSMRAAKARNLLFMGSKYIKPAREAMVEIVFDNKNRTFSIDTDEVSLKRIVRYNGQGVYKINDETKTRIDVVEMLAQAGIDPYGFNLILQGQIQTVVKMPAEDRRKIIEEVAGISIYESRKEKSLRELGKTEEKLKEISAILRERGAFLKNLDRERSQALKFKDIELMVKRCKASILTKRADEKTKEIGSIESSIAEKSTHKDKLRAGAEKIQKLLEEQSEKISHISKHIQQATGLEQETLHAQVANLKVELEGLKVRRESYENRKLELARRMHEMQKSVPSLEHEIKGLKEESPLLAQKAQELKKKKEELSLLEEERKHVLTLKTELQSLRERIKDKERQLTRAAVTSEALLKQLEEYARALAYPTESDCAHAILTARQGLAAYKKTLEGISKGELVHEKQISVSEADVTRAEKITKDVASIDVCPLCQSTITQEHVAHVTGDAHGKIKAAHEEINEARRALKELRQRRETLLGEINGLEEKLSGAEIELIRHKTMKERHEQLKKVVDEEKTVRDELVHLEQRRKMLEEKTIDVSKVEEQYERVMLEIEEISSRTKEDMDTTLLYKERELEGMRNIIKRSTKDLEDLEHQIKELGGNLHEKKGLLEVKEHQERELQARFKKLFEERESLQREVQEQNLELVESQNAVRAVEDQINYLKVGKAKLDAEREALQMELVEFGGVELIQGSIAALDERLRKSQEALIQIGSINMRALEVFEDVKKEYDAVEQKVQTLEREKQEILGIIAEIDQKKKKSFMKTFRAMNALFSSNFLKLSSKGVAFLELENQEDIFAGGVNIVVKLAKGKYFDVTSLSGGEQTLVALSLLFAIQEYKPYHFYLFDEIDAALDKRNSERLAGLLNQYMRAGQYIVITHNDAIIGNANVLYGVSMHDGVSKILSLNVNATIPEAGSAGLGNHPLVTIQQPGTPQDTLSAEPALPENTEEMPQDEDFMPATEGDEALEEEEHARSYEATQRDDEEPGA